MDNMLDLATDWVPMRTQLYETMNDGKNPHVLAKVVGNFFVPDGESRNGRFYSESLWKKCLEAKDVQNLLQNGMIGTLVHPTDEKMAHPMYASHVVKNLYINDKKEGIGEAYVLDTPVGRIVDTFQKSKLVEIFVSSRAFGKLGKQTKNGLPCVDENNYVLRSFDFVLDPGFLQAKPGFQNESMTQVLESYSNCYLDNLSEFNLPKRERDTRAARLIEDMNLILK
jgi:hypothetical protein